MEFYTTLAAVGGLGVLGALVIWLSRINAVKSEELKRALEDAEVKQKQLEIAAQPRPIPSAILERMRKGEL